MLFVFGYIQTQYVVCVWVHTDTVCCLCLGTYRHSMLFVFGYIQTVCCLCLGTYRHSMLFVFGYIQTQYVVCVWVHTDTVFYHLHKTTEFS
jgi:hypothetical protein